MLDVDWVMHATMWLDMGTLKIHGASRYSRKFCAFPTASRRFVWLSLMRTMRAVWGWGQLEGVQNRHIVREVGLFLPSYKHLVNPLRIEDLVSPLRMKDLVSPVRIKDLVNPLRIDGQTEGTIFK